MKTNIKLIQASYMISSNTHLHVSIWKHVFKYEQSPKPSSVCGSIILRKWSFLQSFLLLSSVHSKRVLCEQNSITWVPEKKKRMVRHGGYPKSGKYIESRLPPCERNRSVNDRCFVVGLLSKSSISSPIFFTCFSRMDGVLINDCRNNR